ncbi:MAG TPA: hypothetical protein PJ988_12680 [Anaerolinea sp.]|nr:hypothetical protein [Anaerolinea sp.]
MDLSGQWQFALDPQDEGLQAGWFNTSLAQSIRLPGSLQAQGHGDPISLDTPWTGGIVDRSFFEDPRYEKYRQPGQVKVPFWLQPETYYLGPAWYQREVEIPAEWAGKRVTLFLERAHWETLAWVDEQYAGSNVSLSTPHVYDLSAWLTPGHHRLTLRVDNRRVVNVGPNAHSISDHTQTNWNGVVGRIELEAGSPVWVDLVKVFPQVAGRSARVEVRLRSMLGHSVSGTLALQAHFEGSTRAPEPKAVKVEVSIPAEGAQEISVEYPLGAAAQLWDEFNPALYRLEVKLSAGGLTSQQVTRFGLREVGVMGTQLSLNGRPIFIRGTLESAIFPLTGYPPTDVEAWKRILRVASSHGLNQLRFHSWCPPEAAFQAADEEGLYLSVEIASWANQGAGLGEGDPLDQWLYEEAQRISDTYGNHPSWIMMAYGNEPAGNITEYLGKWVTYWKEHEPRRAHTSGAGWPAIPENDYHNLPEPRIQAWGQGLTSRINALPPETLTDYRDYVARMGKPVVSHEIGQWCAFPNFDEIPKYTGHLKAKNYEIFRDFLEANHMGDQARAFLMASGKLQALCYKEDIESALRTPGFGGFHLLDLHDFPGQGTALVGVLDAFWDSKGYIHAEEYRRFCGPTVPLARLARRIFQAGETLEALIDLAHYGPRDLPHTQAAWQLTDADGQVVMSGRMAPVDAPAGGPTHLGKVRIPLRGLAAPAKYRLVVSVEAGAHENDWEVWVYPSSTGLTEPAGVRIAHRLDEQALAYLQEGGSLLLLADPASVKTPVQIGFSSIFWNTAWTMNQPPHTLGLLVDPQHPLFAAFPTEEHSNWQWWDLVHGSAAVAMPYSTAWRPRLEWRVRSAHGPAQACAAS